MTLAGEGFLGKRKLPDEIARNPKRNNIAGGYIGRENSIESRTVVHFGV